VKKSHITKSAVSPPIRLGRLALVLAVIVPLGLSHLARSQQATDPGVTQSFFKSLDQQTANAKDAASIRALFLEIHNRTVFGPLPESILQKAARAQENFLKGTQPPITEEAIANAVNTMGKTLIGNDFTGTNTMQVHLLRIRRLAVLPTLLATGSPRPADKIVANDMSPAGAVYLGLLLLRQKVANPAWFGDPDAQNKQLLSAQFKAVPRGKVIRVKDEPDEQATFRMMLQRGLADEGSSTTKAYHSFMDNLGISK